MNRSFFSTFRDYQEISVRYDAEHLAVWCYYNPSPRPCFSLQMLQELRQVQQSIIDYFGTIELDTEPLIRYVVLCSQVSGVFNLGGDLALFRELIKKQERERLLDYARRCIDICYLYATNMHLPLTTISLVEGAALGGGFESALSGNVLIATEESEMGFPEIRFNLFPGMGAYSLLARKCDLTTTEKIIHSGNIYSARELYDMGIVHYVAESGTGPESVERYIRRHRRVSNGHRALQQVRQRYNPLQYKELSDIVDIWVDAAMRLEERDLRMMDRLVQSQLQKISPGGEREILRTKQERRIAQPSDPFPLQSWSGETVERDRRKNIERRS
jgi:DSF synthase